MSITIKPANHLLVRFAKWATVQEPKVKTNGHDSFAVPPDQFGHIPDYLLNGSLVDWQPWVAPEVRVKPKPRKAAKAPATVESMPETVTVEDVA